MTGAQNFESGLKTEDYAAVGQNIKEISLIEARTPEIEDTRVPELREVVFKEFDGTVFRDKVDPDPP